MVFTVLGLVCGLEVADVFGYMVSGFLTWFWAFLNLWVVSFDLWWSCWVF